MPLEIEHLEGHKVTVDATSDPEHVSLTCSCGGLAWQGGPPSGAEMVKAADILRAHMSEHGKKFNPEAPEIAKSYAGLFDMLFPPG